MRINKAELERIAVNQTQNPKPYLPEIAFAGRSM